MTYPLYISKRKNLDLWSHQQHGWYSSFRIPNVNNWHDHLTFVEKSPFCGKQCNWCPRIIPNMLIFMFYILQPPNYLIIVVNRFRYINNQFAKDKCSIPMDMTVVLGYHKFSLQATIDHHGPSIYSGHYTTSVNCCNRTFYCNDNKITEFDMINTKNSSTAYVVIYKLIT